MVIHEEIQQLKFTGAVDADGHILEDAGLWERYLEAKYKDRAIRIRNDAKGFEYLEIAGRPSKIFNGGKLGGLSAMGTTRDDEWGNRPTYGGMAPFGAMDPKERLARIEAEGLAAAFLYPTLSLVYETELDDVELAQAYTRAYNRYIVDFCADSGGKLIPVAHLSLGDPGAAAQELERAVKAGCKGGWVAQFTMTRKPHAHPDHDVLFAKAEELGVPLGIHPSLEPNWALPGRYDRQYTRGQYYFLNVTAADAIRHAFTSFFQYGAFDKFPQLKLVLLEAGAGWIAYWLDRLDAVYGSLMGRTVPLKEKPSFYFKRNCWISADPDERSLPAMVELCGADKFFWASDFPHPDHVGNYIEEVEELGSKLAPDARAKVLGENVMKVYGCDR
ncbi:MAG: amidohydrolase family protein [Candidatus Binatus sp.]|uniref:amidohydrolase family protein n=1 Tax=Candidatus Binatus sp. TaxID=2811406 RepID=UPI00271C4050|nr:amidohydrolase family protein [Candidatus Binatus sp.]MDO8431716.1 amidohydrolase family protein [Candidatus Binatus sp.]